MKKILIVDDDKKSVAPLAIRLTNAGYEVLTSFDGIDGLKLAVHHRLALALSVRLKAHGYATWIAGDCITAVSTAIDIQPDLILLDVSLPAGNGFTLIEQFDRFPELSETPIILATASKDPELRS